MSKSFFIIIIELELMGTTYLKFEIAARASEKGNFTPSSSQLKLRTPEVLDVLLPAIHLEDSFDDELDEVLGDSLTDGLGEVTAEPITARRSTTAVCLMSQRLITPFVVAYASKFECVG